jgi:uncharacterized protein YdhG (YjbR/CyaY superfamily)
MEMRQAKAETIDEYIAAFEGDVRARLEQLRAAIRQAAPQAGERISYRIPTFSLSGNLVHFAGFERHVGFYPGPSGIEKFAKELSSYQSAKGSVQFPHDRPLPLGLVRKIVRFRLEENLAKHAGGRRAAKTEGKRKTHKKAGAAR